jgi:hypothetical protein
MPPKPRPSFKSSRPTSRGVLRGQDSAIRRLLAAFAAGGHVLLDDFPGTGKTTLAKTIALSIASRFHRIQFTPDLMPTDIVGVSVFNQRDQSFEFREGPVFTDILLADEINRASPRTQSAMLEAMAEGQVSVDGQRRPLSDLFFTIATQNPVEFRGTYPAARGANGPFHDAVRAGLRDGRGRGGRAVEPGLGSSDRGPSGPVPRRRRSATCARRSARSASARRCSTTSSVWFRRPVR